MSTMNGKVALVTGASNGIGRRATRTISAWLRGGRGEWPPTPGVVAAFVPPSPLPQTTGT